MRSASAFALVLVALISLHHIAAADPRFVPQVQGEWWSVTGNPDLGKYASPNQQPVDFGIWQAADGSWQLWSCIRHTKCGGNTRLFYRWQGENLTGANWQPMGIAMEAEPALGESKGGLQAPYVFKEGDVYYMVYGDWTRICLAKSSDGKKFHRVLNEAGEPALFSGPYQNSRDPMILKYHGLYFCYYMGHNKEAEYDSAIFCRTSENLKQWSEPILVSAGGSADEKSNWYGGDAECPFVVERKGMFVLFRNQRYGQDNLNTQYASPNLLNFGVGHDLYRIGELPVAAPEVFEYEGEWYIAALKPSLDGIRIARLKWVEAP